MDLSVFNRDLTNADTLTPPAQFVPVSPGEAFSAGAAAMRATGGLTSTAEMQASVIHDRYSAFEKWSGQPLWQATVDSIMRPTSGQPPANRDLLPPLQKAIDSYNAANPDNQFPPITQADVEDEAIERQRAALQTAAAADAGSVDIWTKMAGLAGGLWGYFEDPGNIMMTGASIPAAELVLPAAAARVGKLAAATAVAGADAGLQQIGIEAVNYPQYQKLFPGYDLRDSLGNIAENGALAGIIHVGATGLGGFTRLARRGEANLADKLPVDLPTKDDLAVTEAAVRDQVSNPFASPGPAPYIDLRPIIGEQPGTAAPVASPDEMAPAVAAYNVLREAFGDQRPALPEELTRESGAPEAEGGMTTISPSPEPPSFDELYQASQDSRRALRAVQSIAPVDVRAERQAAQMAHARAIQAAERMMLAGEPVDVQDIVQPFRPIGDDMDQHVAAWQVLHDVWGEQRIAREAGETPPPLPTPLELYQRIRAGADELRGARAPSAAATPAIEPQAAPAALEATAEPPAAPAKQSKRSRSGGAVYDRLAEGHEANARLLAESIGRMTETAARLRTNRLARAERRAAQGVPTPEPSTTAIGRAARPEDYGWRLSEKGGGTRVWTNPDRPGEELVTERGGYWEHTAAGAAEPIAEGEDGRAGLLDHLDQVHGREPSIADLYQRGRDAIAELRAEVSAPIAQPQPLDTPPPAVSEAAIPAKVDASYYEAMRGPLDGELSRWEDEGGPALAELPRQEGGRPTENPQHDVSGLSPTTAELGISHTERGRLEAPARGAGQVRAPKPLDAVQFLAAHGGVRLDAAGELKAIFPDRSPFVPKIGPLIRPKGMTLGEAGELLAEHGYLGEARMGRRQTEHAAPPGDEAEALAVLGRHARGERVFSADDIERVLDDRETRAAEVAGERYDDATDRLRELGLSDQEIADYHQLIAAGVEPEDALVTVQEREPLEVSRNVRDTTDHDIPFDEAPAGSGGEPASAGASGERPGTEGGPGAPGERAQERGAVPGERTGPAREGDQGVIPGAERISDRELAERRMQGPARAGAPQRPADEGLFDTGARNQVEMFKETATAARARVAEIDRDLDAITFCAIGKAPE